MKIHRFHLLVLVIVVSVIGNEVTVRALLPIVILIPDVTNGAKCWLCRDWSKGIVIVSTNSVCGWDCISNFGALRCHAIPLRLVGAIGIFFAAVVVLLCDSNVWLRSNDRDNVIRLRYVLLLVSFQLINVLPWILRYGNDAALAIDDNLL